MGIELSSRRWIAYTCVAVAGTWVMASPGFAASPQRAASVVASSRSAPGKIAGAIALNGTASATPAPSDCSDYSGYAQPFTGQGAGSEAYTAEAGLYLPADSSLDLSSNIAPLGAGALDKLRWWGVSLVFDPSFGLKYDYCDQDDLAGTPYDLVFYADDGGAPGKMLAKRTVVPSYFVTSDCFDCTDFKSYVEQYEATLTNPVDATNVAWIGIQRHAGGSLPNGMECYFTWMSAIPHSYDDVFRQLNETSGVWNTVANDLTFCTDIGAAQSSYEDLFDDGFEAGDWRYWSLVVSNIP